MIVKIRKLRLKRDLKDCPKIDTSVTEGEFQAAAIRPRMPRVYSSHLLNCQQAGGCLSQKTNATVNPLQKETALISSTLPNTNESSSRLAWRTMSYFSMTITNNLKSDTDFFYRHTFVLAPVMRQPQLMFLSQEAISLPLIRICAYILSKLLQ